MALDNLAAAGQSQKSGYFRCAASRAYYAVYAMATEKLAGIGASFPQGRRGPTHEALPKMVEQLALPRGKQKDVKRMIRVLYATRIDADYNPMGVVGEREVRTSMQYARAGLSTAGRTAMSTAANLTEHQVREIVEPIISRNQPTDFRLVLTTVAYRDRFQGWVAFVDTDPIEGVSATAFANKLADIEEQLEDAGHEIRVFPALYRED